MKYINTTMILLGALLAAGCSPSSEDKNASNETIEKQMDHAQKSASEMTVDLKEYSYEQKDAFVKLMKEQHSELEVNIQKLADSSADASDEVKAELKPKLTTLREQASQMEEQIDEIENATESTWEGIKSDSHQAYVALKDGVNASRQWVSEKISP